MSSWTIYDKSGVAKAVVKELELHDEWMAECFLTVTVKSEQPVYFAVGDYIDYRNERYTINYDPSVVKKARRDTYGEGFVYDNIKFVSVQDELVRCDFNDIVLADNQIHYTSLPTFPFYCETADDLLDRIQANLEELYPGEWVVISPIVERDRQRGRAVGRENDFVAAYNKYIGGGSFTYEKTGVAETVDNINCWDALAKVHEDFGLDFIVRGRVVIVGTAGVFTNRKFRYGKGNGLYEIELIGDSEQKIVTRLRAYGAETNLPLNYYAHKHDKMFIAGTKDTIVAEYAGGYTTYLIRTRITYGSIKAAIRREDTRCLLSYGDKKCYALFDPSADEETGVSYLVARLEKYTEYSDLDFYNAISDGDRVYIAEGVNIAMWPTEYIETGGDFPALLTINRLMLPGFPDKSLLAWVQENRPQLIEEGFRFSNEINRPYIDSPNIEFYGIRPSSIYFDGNSENEDIHPTIEGMEWEGVDSDRVVSAQQIDDNGVLPENATSQELRVNVTIPYAGFELDTLWQEGAAIEMKDGMCGARTLKIAQQPTKDSDGNWVCVCERAYDETLHIYFPYSDFQIASGDHFVITGIDLPDSYIVAASIRLFDAAVEALRKNHAPRVTFQPRIDEIWMQRQHDDAMASHGVIESLHDTMKAGDYFMFADDDLGIDAKIIIDILTIKENGNNGIPTYEVTLREEKVVSTLDKRLQKITSSTNGGAGGGGYSSHQIGSMIEGEGSSLFLSKIYDDEAQGVIGFLKGAWFGVKNWMIDALGNANFNNTMVNGQLTANHVQSTQYTGDSMFDTGYLLQFAKGKAKLVIDNIICRGKFVVNEIEDRIWTYAGGNLIFSAAGSTIFYVEYLDAQGQALGYTYINSPWLLKKIPLLAGIIAWSKRRNVQRQLTPEEKQRVVKFRCYETSDDGTMQTRNWWHVNDLAYCQTLNRVKDKVSETGGYSGSLSNTVYWRRVAAIGSKKIPLINDEKIYDYVELWNIENVYGQTYIDDDGSTKTITDNVAGYDTSFEQDWPAAGDVIVQRGNAVNGDRQGFSTVEVTGTQRGFRVFDNVSDYTMVDKQKTFIGYDANKRRAQLDVFGDAYIGVMGNGPDPHDGAAYVRFNSQRGLLEIKAKIDASSTVDGKALENYINGLITDITDAIQVQVDQKAETWYQAADPSTAWTTPEERAEHVGDLWHRTTDNKSFYYTAGGWVEEFIPDEVFDTIDGKANIYVSWGAWIKEDENQLHVRDLFIPTADVTIGGVAYKANKVYRCTTAGDNPVFQEVDYTDDTALTDFISGTYSQFVQDIQGQVDQKAETWYQSTDPAAAWTTPTLKSEHIGDIWHNTSSQTVSGVEAGQDAIWSGSAWVPGSVPQAVYDTIDGKSSVYVSQPSSYMANDLWILAADTTLNGILYKKGEVLTATQDSTSFVAAHWVKKVNYTNDDAFLNWKAGQYAEDILNINNDISAAQSSANGAKSAADAAQSTANAAVSSAQAANTKLSTWASDSYISPTEKTGLKNQWIDVQEEYEQIIADAGKYNVNTSTFTWYYNLAVAAFTKYTASSPENIAIDSDYANISNYYSARQTILNSIASAAKTYAEEVAEAEAKAVSDTTVYLRNALKAKTTLEGGLIMTTLIGLRKYNGTGDASDPSNYTTYGGLNGVYETGDTIAAWFGGGMTESGNNRAKTVFRMNGSGYLADKNITWDASGNCSFSGSITSTSGSIGGFNIGTSSLGPTGASQTASFTLLYNDGRLVIRNQNTNRYAIQTLGNISMEAVSEYGTAFSITGANVSFGTTATGSTTTIKGSTITIGSSGATTIGNSSQALTLKGKGGDGMSSVGVIVNGAPLIVDGDLRTKSALKICDYFDQTHEDNGFRIYYSSAGKLTIKALEHSHWKTWAGREDFPIEDGEVYVSDGGVLKVRGYD